MIIRLFKAKVNKGMEAAFEKDFVAFSRPLIEGMAGVKSVSISKPTDLSSGEYMMISVWESYEAIEAAIGAGWREAHIPDNMAKYFEAFSLEHLEEL